MEKDIGKIPKGMDSEIIIRIDDYGGKRGLTIREFVSSERYTGFTKAGTRIPADKFREFKAMINSIDENEMEAIPEPAPAKSAAAPQKKKSEPKQKKIAPEVEEEEVEEDFDKE